tara:strand:- start:2131 stop:2571 length:441 start_codon:yes stop_codon:yes gene_type:complete
MFLRKLTIIHAALVITLLIFGAITYSFGVGFVTNFDTKSDTFIYIVPIIALLGYFGSIYIFKKQIRNISSSEELQLKLAKYQTASIIKYAVIEGPTLLIFFEFMNSGYTLYFTIACCLLLYLAVQRPNKNRLIQELNLNTEEQRKL